MTQRLHPVFGGELTDISGTTFRDVADILIVGILSGYARACNACKAEARRIVDNAHMRHSIAHLHRLRDEEHETSATVELGG